MKHQAKIAIQICQLFGIAATVCKKQWIGQIPQKKKKKNEYNRSEFPAQKSDGFGL